MPETVSPFEAVFMGESFAFSVEANYGYGGSLGNMGTFIGNSGGPFVYLSREPLACVTGKGSLYVIKPSPRILWSTQVPRPTQSSRPRIRRLILATIRQARERRIVW